MSIVELLAAFSDPATIKNLTSAQLLLAGLVTTALGMGITFLALIVLQLVTSLLAMVGEREPAAPGTTAAETDNRPGEELVAAITTAVALLLETGPESIVIRSITRIDGSGSAWSRSGISEQVRNDF